MLTRIVLLFLLSLTLNWNVNAASTLHIGFGASNPCAKGCGGHPNTNPNGYLLSANFDIFQGASGYLVACGVRSSPPQWK
jgi:hypothetical protein